MTDETEITEGSFVRYRDSLWNVYAVIKGKDEYDNPKPILDAVKIQWQGGSHSVIESQFVLVSSVEPLTDMEVIAISATDSMGKSTLPNVDVIEAASDPRTVVTTGRILVRQTSNAEIDGKTVQRHIIAGVILGDLDLPTNESGFEDDELWLCAKIILVPMAKFRGSERLGMSLDQALTGRGLDPNSYRESVCD